MIQRSNNSINQGAEHKKNIRSAIDSLLSSGSTEVPVPTVKLTECSPDVDVVNMNKQGGICTKCNVMFKSRTSLMSHLEKCSPNNNNNTDKNNKPGPKLVIISQ